MRLDDAREIVRVPVVRRSDVPGAQRDVVLAEHRDQESELGHERLRARSERVHHRDHPGVVLVEEQAAVLQVGDVAEDEEPHSSKLAPRDVHLGLGRGPGAGLGRVRALQPATPAIGAGVHMRHRRIGQERDRPAHVLRTSERGQEREVGDRLPREAHAAGPAGDLGRVVPCCAQPQADKRQR